MKKLFHTLFGTMLAASPLTVLAQNQPTGIAPTTRPNVLPGEESFGQLLINVINWFLGLVGLVAVLMLVIGGFRYITAAGNDEAVQKAKNTIIYAIIGIIVVILSFAIVATITRSLEAL